MCKINFKLLVSSVRLIDSSIYIIIALLEFFSFVCQLTNIAFSALKIAINLPFISDCQACLWSRINSHWEILHSTNDDFICLICFLCFSSSLCSFKQAQNSGICFSHHFVSSDHFSQIWGWFLESRWRLEMFGGKIKISYAVNTENCHACYYVGKWKSKPYLMFCFAEYTLRSAKCI